VASQRPPNSSATATSVLALYIDARQKRPTTEAHPVSITGVKPQDWVKFHERRSNHGLDGTGSRKRGHHDYVGCYGPAFWKGHGRRIAPSTASTSSTPPGHVDFQD